jgi:hypothetical protein
MQGASAMKWSAADGPLTGLTVALLGEDGVLWQAGRLLASLGARLTRHASGAGIALAVRGRESDAWPIPVVGTERLSAAATWALSGAMALTGRRDGPPLSEGGGAAQAAHGAALAFQALATHVGLDVDISARMFLSERAALLGLGRNAPWSCAGSSTFVRCADGLVVATLARPVDIELLPALVESDPKPGDPWTVLADWARTRPAAEIVGRASMLGLAMASVPGSGLPRSRPGPVPGHAMGRDQGQTAPWVLRRGGADGHRPRRLHWSSPLVVDLSALWAGPLCAHLLGLAGARVIKVESVGRPDGTRYGARRFFDLLHAGHESVALDFANPADRSALLRLLHRADVILDSARPRAIEQLGIDVNEVISASEGRCWIGVSAYGRTGVARNRIGFGDDVAAGAGLVAWDPGDGRPVFCGDAIADPLTGLHAALVALACVLRGGSFAADVPLRAAADIARALGWSSPAGVDAAEHRRGEWALADEPDVRVVDGVVPAVCGSAPEMGADTDAVLAELAR